MFVCLLRYVSCRISVGRLKCNCKRRRKPSCPLSRYHPCDHHGGSVSLGNGEHEAAAAHPRVSDSGEVCGQTKYAVVVTKAVSHPQTTLQLLWQRGSEFQQSAVTYAFYRVNDPSSVESWYPGFARHSHHRVRSVAPVQRAPHCTVQLAVLFSLC